MRHRGVRHLCRFFPSSVPALVLIAALAACTQSILSIDIREYPTEIPAGETVMLAATVPMSAGLPVYAVRWSASAGTIAPADESGASAVYTAPATPGTVRITAFLQSDPPLRKQVQVAIVLHDAQGPESDPEPDPDPDPDPEPDPEPDLDPEPDPDPEPEPEPDPDFVRLVAAGDIACSPTDAYFNEGVGRDGRCVQAATAALALSLEPDAVIALGDLQYTDGGYSAFMKSYHPSWGRLNHLVMPMFGNHEYGPDPTAKGYVRYFREQAVWDRLPEAAADPTRGYYSFDLGAWKVILLNGVCEFVAGGGCAAGSTQHDWLLTELAEAGERCTLVAVHYPLFNAGRNDGEETMTDFFTTSYEAGVDLMLVADEHRYERFAPLDPSGARDDERGVPYFIVGTGGKQLYPGYAKHPMSEVMFADSPGVLALDLYQGGYAFEFHPVPGFPSTDSGYQACR